MFVLMFYDVGEKRVGRVLKTARRYLTWIQNSVLEGDLSPATFEALLKFWTCNTTVFCFMLGVPSATCPARSWGWSAAVRTLWCNTARNLLYLDNAIAGFIFWLLAIRSGWFIKGYRYGIFGPL